MARECCGCLLFWEWGDEAEYRAWYGGHGYHSVQQAEERLPPTPARDQEHQIAAMSRLRLLQPAGLFSKLLDLGAGMGAFVAAAAGFGWQAVGLEPCGAMVAEAVELGRPLVCGGWEDLESDTTRYEVVTCFDVLEHLTRPVAALRAMTSVLAPGGVLLVEMPEYLAPLGAWERHIRPRQHVCLYSEAAARELFSRAGLVLCDLTRPKGGALGKAAYWLRKASTS